MNILIILILLALLTGCITAGLARSRGTVAANSLGTHAGHITRLADGALSTRHLLVTVGSDANHVAVADADEVPLGVLTDEAEAAEDPVNVALLGSAASTVKMVAAALTNAGSVVYTRDGGKVGPTPIAAGTYYCVGVALSSAAVDGDLVEVDPCVAQLFVVEE